MNYKNKLISYIDHISLIILGLFLLLFPIFFITLTTDNFILPKEIILTVCTFAILILLAIKNIIQNKVVMRRTAFDLPIVLFIITVFLSAVFSVDRINALTAFIPMLLAVLLYFCITNTVKDKKAIIFSLYALTAGGVIASMLAVMSFLKIFILPFPITHSPQFSPFGSLLDQTIYLSIIFTISIYFCFPVLKGAAAEYQEFQSKNTQLISRLACFIIFAGLLITVYQLIYIQPPVLLPFGTGFQTGFAAISQDTTRLVKGFLFGSGFGTYSTDFTRFKQASFNSYKNLWSLTFLRSSSFVLELLSTTGILGILSFFFLIYTVIRQKQIFIPLILILLLSFVLPFSFIPGSLLFILLGIYASIKGLKNPNGSKNSQAFFDAEFELVAWKKGVFSVTPAPNRVKAKKTLNLFTFSILIPIFAFIMYIGFLGTKYVMADIIFNNSLTTSSQNNGVTTYADQIKAISLFNKDDAYYRIFSQTNLSLANSLSATINKSDTQSQKNQQITQTVYTLIQQSIAAARNATAISPLNAADWQNLASIYQSLIVLGKNANTFAQQAASTAINLDPNNPLEYITLGGIYYQTGNYIQSQQEFQTAIDLKPDYANAYYNLAQAMVKNGNLKGALSQLETVKMLVSNNPTSLSKVTTGIKALQEQIGKTNTSSNYKIPATTLPNTSNTNSQLKKSDLDVYVENGSGQPGSAGQVVQFLKNLGYKIGLISNADNFSYNKLSIQIKADKKAYLPLLESDLSKNYSIANASDNLSSGSPEDALVIVGK